IYFFGFDLTIPEAKGGSGHPPDTDPGWFFVIKERPGEPRFGLELTRDANPEVLDELTWDDAIPGGKPGSFLSAGSLASVGRTQRALAAAQARLAASSDPQRRDEQAAALERELREAAANARARADAVQKAKEGAASASAVFAEFSDPRRNVARLSDRSPFALLPVRIETR